MIQSAQNNVIVKVATDYIGNISDLLKRSAIQNNSSVDPVDYVNIVGEIISIPKSISNKRDYEGFSTKDIKVGDTAIFSYAVIYSLVTQEEGAEPIYKNKIKHNGKEYFLADIRNIYGVIRNGGIIMVNGYVMLSEYEKSKIVMAASYKQSKGVVKSKVMHIGNCKENAMPISVIQGDTVFFNPSKSQHYQINNKPFIILNQSQILSKEVMN